MGLLELFILAVGLSMDAFAVSVCKGLSVKKMEPKHALICGCIFWRIPGSDADDRLPSRKPV